MKNIRLLLLLTFVYFSGYSQSSKTVTIGIVADKSTVETRSLLTELQNEIRSVVGQSANIVFKEVLENGFDNQTAKSNYQTLLNSNADIILAFGLVNTIMIDKEEQYPKPIILFGSANSDFYDFPDGQKNSGIANITYLIAPFSYRDDLDVFKALYDYNKVGIVIDDFISELLPIKKLFDEYFSKNGGSYELIPLQKDGSIPADLTDIDAIYLAAGFYLNDREFKTLVTNINAKKLPSFSAYSKEDVEKGILASNQPETNIDQFFRRIALNVEAIIDGTNPSELPMYINYKKKLSINYSTAKQIEFPLRYSMLASADFIGGENDIKEGTSYSIIDIMKGVVEKNLSLDVERKNIELSTQDVKTAKSSYLPNVTANANAVYLDPKVAEISNGANPEFSTSGNVTLEQVIYSEGAGANITISENIRKAQNETYNAAELDALLNASVAYFNALVLKTNAEIQNQNLQLTKKNLEIADQNFAAGESGKSDVLRFRSQLAQNTQSLINAENQKQQAFNAINQLMNNPIATEIDIDNAKISEGVFENYKYQDFLKILDDPKLRPTLIEFLVEEAKKNAPELKNIGYNMEATQRNYRLNNLGRFVPTVALQGQYNLAISESGKGTTVPTGFPTTPEGTYNVGVNLSLPIFQQNQRNINRQTAKIQEDQLLIQKENIELNIERNVNDILLDIINQIANIEISKVSEETAKESLDLTQNAYAQGAVPLIQLIDAQTNYLQAQLARATANYDYLLTSMQLERAIGYFFLMNDEASNQDFIQRATQYILNKN
ncbi:TolC family protein [Aquimarina sp. RZ0]|uniref:TolC family protein n=1 Tax=Aquimarina sp. RZ0 TaxID=2607730 RepID=UPI0011F20900|nr:TolC family protein [Aquimarina sp. RZ0]KAA1244444.1 TolC family protein [Aquimarina sp. RZ0]